jgi:hypothetical protein
MSSRRRVLVALPPKMSARRLLLAEHGGEDGGEGDAEEEADVAAEVGDQGGHGVAPALRQDLVGVIIKIGKGTCEENPR